MSERKYNRVAVLMGGPTSERDVSIKSGQAVARALRKAGYEASDVVADKMARYNLPEHCEAVFMAVHGEYGEDGRFQRELHAAGIPYTGTVYDKMMLSFDKIRTKEILQARELPTAEFEVLVHDDTELELPVVLKPALQGSSIGVEIVKHIDDWDAALVRIRKLKEDILVEKYIPGRELTVGILGDRALPVLEIEAPDGHFDYKAKYASLGRTRYTVPAELSEATTRRAQELALECFDLLGCKDLARVDFRLNPEEELFILELNSIPGFTETSLLPKAAAAEGLNFEDFCATIMEMASLG